MNTCFNGGTCTTSHTLNQYTVECICPTGFSGSRCQITGSNTANNCLCQNGAICQTDGSCRCLANFYGVKCEFDFNIGTTVSPSVTCPTDLCIHGTCQVATDNSYFCYCNSGYTGIRCEDPINVCQTANPCRNGVCTSQNNNQYTCSCYQGWSGLNCEINGN